MNPFDSAQRAARFDSVFHGPSKSRQIYVGPVTLVGIQGFNNASDTRYVMLFDAPDCPADGTVPVVVIKAAAGANFFMELPITGMPFQNGIALAVSTTPTTLTLSGTEDVLVWGSIVGDVA